MKRGSICLLILAVSSVQAQNQLGLRTSNYTGVNSLLLNPAAFHSAPLSWDVNLVSTGAFFYNEFVYVENTNLLRLLNHDGPFLSRPDNQALEVMDNPDALYYNFFDQRSSFSNSGNAFVTGPSVAIGFNTFSVGIFTNFRVAGAANRLDEDLDYFSLDTWMTGETKNINPLNSSGMAWSEVGINVATTVKKDHNSKLDAGINLKYLMGHEAFFARSRNEARVTSLADTSIVRGGPFDYGIASSAANEGFGINGSGISADLGFTCIKKSSREKPYAWRLGVSLLDIGFIHFDQNAQKHQLTGSDFYTLDRSALSASNTIEELLMSTSQEALGDPNQSLAARDFTILTPGALSVQFDYALHQNWFVNTTVNRRFNLHPITVDRENFWSVAVRYESTWFEAGVPLVLYNDQHLRVGSWVRFAFLTIGSDHINSIFFKQDQFAGSDVYLALRINSLNNPFGAKGGSKGKRSPEKCYF